MRFKLNGLEFDLEGSETTVKEEFEKFKSFVSGELLPKMNMLSDPPNPIPKEKKILNIGGDQIVEDDYEAEYPEMKEIIMKDYPKTESDWVLIYGFYASKFGTDKFSEQSIRDLYESSGRKNTNRLANFSNNLKYLLKHDYIKVFNETEYIIKDAGNDYAKLILQGKSSGRSNSKNSSKVKTSGSKGSESVQKKGSEKKPKSTNQTNFIDLKFSAEEQNSLSKFLVSKKPKTQNENVLVAMKWFKSNKNSEEISLEEIYYILSLSAEVPSALAQVLTNMIGAKFRYVTKSSSGKYQLSSIGERFVDNKLPKIDK